MGSSPPPAPPPPDPIKTGAAQTGTNISTAVANSVLGNANQFTPYGSVYNQITGYVPVLDPNSGTTYNIPQYTQETVLNPVQQAIFNQQQQNAYNLGGIAGNQIRNVGDILSTPVSSPGDMQTGIDTNFDKQVSDAQNAILSRLTPEMDRQRAALDTRLQQQGFVPGNSSNTMNDAYNTGMDSFNRQYNDLLLQSDLAAQQEQQALFGQSLQAGQFHNQALEQQLQQQAYLRDEPINEITALLSGSQVQQPNANPYNPGTIAPTPIGDMYYQNYAGENQAYQSQLQYQAQSNAGLYSALGSVGSGLFGALGKMSDRRLKDNVQRIGTWLNGLPVYAFRYLWGEWDVGFMADEVEALIPAAVYSFGGYKCVDYERAGAV